MNEAIARAVRDRMPDAEVTAAVEGNRALITVVSSEFAGMSRVAKQQAIYACIDHLIKDGTLHAVSIRALTPDENA
ncbi:MAG: BolA/IbaG family iron-sulfur metabolism protein [Pseudomonadales bacterium]